MASSRNLHLAYLATRLGEDRGQVGLLRGGWLVQGGWNILAHTNLLLLPSPDRRAYRAYLAEPSGGVVAYQYSHRENKQDNHIFFLKPARSISRAYGKLSARTTPQGNLLRLDLRKGEAVLLLPDGGKHVYCGPELSNYKQSDSFGRYFYLLQTEQLPSQHQFCYFYDQQKNLERIEARNPQGNKIYSSINFTYTPGNADFLSRLTATTSDHKEIQYLAGYYNNRECIHEAYSSCKPEEQHHLKCHRKGIGPRVTSFNVGGKKFSVSYYIPKDKKQEEKWAASPSEIPREADKVYAVYAPLGPDGEMTGIVRFNYQENFTLVQDAEGSYTQYHHDGEKLTTICYYDRNHQLHSYQKFYWSGSQLYSKVMFTGDNRPLFSKTFRYEGENVVEEILLGNLTGKETAPFRVNIAGQFWGAENYCKKYSYYPNNLLKNEIEEGGTVSAYFYKPGTDLLSAKFTKDQEGNILIRLFYFYDEDNFLIREIADNGTSSDPNEYSGVTQRLEKHIERNPSSGLPETSTEFYWDPDEGKLQLLKKSKLLYQNQKVVEEEIYDAEDSYRYTIYTEYDTYGNVQRRTNSLGQEEWYEYDALGLCKRSKETGSPEKLYDYDAAGRLLSSLETDSGKSTTTSYDNKGRILLQTDPRGNTTHYSYDNFGNRLSALFPKMADEQDTVYEPLLSFTYNVQGDLIKTTNSQGETTQTSYNLFRKPTRIVQADGTVIAHLYHKNGLLAKTTYPDGTEEHYTYDIFQRITEKLVYAADQELLSKELFIYNAVQLLSYTDPRGLTTHFFYDGAGRKIREEAGERKIAFTYDALGFLERVDNGCSTIVQKHNPLGLIEEQWEEDTTGTIENRMRFIYDKENRKIEAIRTTSQGKARDLFAYKEGRLVLHTDPEGNSTQFLYDEEVVNELGQKVLSKTTIDPLGNQTIEIYDVGERPVVIEKKNPEGKTVFKEKIIYDRAGNRAKLLSYVYVEGKITKEIAVSWKYDAMGRVIEENEAGQKTASFAYDSRGRLTEHRLPSGMKIYSVYDGLGRLLLQSSSDGAIHEEYLYKHGPDPVAIFDHANGTKIERSYNSFGELLSESSSSGFTTSWTYDQLGRCTALLLPDGSSIDYTHLGPHLKAVQRRSADQKLLYEHTYDRFDPNGHVAEESLIFQLGRIETSHDLLERPLQQSSSYLTHRVSYGPSGLLLHKKNSLLGDKEYAYDALKQLTKEGDDSYQFDSLGNATAHETNDLNQVVSTEDTTFLYDANGNLCEKISPAGHIFYSFDPRGRLTEIVYPAEKKVQYFYDPLSRLLAKETYQWQDGSWQKEEKLYFLYDRDKEIGTLDEEGNILQLKVLGLGIKGDIGAAVALELAGAAYAPLHDFNGNIIAILSKEGTIMESYAMDAFGKEHGGSSLNPWRFSSKRSEEELIFFGLRFYDPSLGRWLTPDPAGFADGANLYLFVHNSPTNRLDLFGLLGEDPYGQKIGPLAIWVPNIAACLNGQLIFSQGLHSDGALVDYVVCCNYLHKIEFTPHEMVNGKFNLFDHPEIIPSSSQIALCTYRHGINTLFPDFLETCRFIKQQLPGTLFVGKYHGTEGVGKDLRQAGVEKCGIETKEVCSTRQFLITCSQFLHKANPAVFKSSGALQSLGALWAHIDHSRGGVIDLRAIESMSSEQQKILQTQLLLTAVAPAAPIPRKFGLEIINYYSDSDFMTGLFGSSKARAVWNCFTADEDLATREANIRALRDCDIKFVRCVSESNERISGADHAILGGTYRGVISKAIGEYQKSYGFYDGKTR